MDNLVRHILLRIITLVISVKKPGVMTPIMMSGICTMNTAIKVFFLALIIGCEVYAPVEYSPYRPSLGGDYYLQYEACGQESPYALEDALVCEDACCIWASQDISNSLICEEIWCCDSNACEWFLHYEECY
jgi:hypothetical protein